jgi:hypothetical protein
MRSLSPVRAVLVVLLLALVLPATMPRTSSAQAPVVAAPTFSVTRGFYDAPFNLTLGAQPGQTVYYTLDGATPTTSSTAFTTPIAISTSTVVRALAHSQAQGTSSVVTHSYIFPAAVRSQSATPLPGWPPVFAIADGVYSLTDYPADYQVDPEVVSQYSTAQFDSALKALPSLSLVTDLSNLWHGTGGIYLNPNASGTDPFANMWERATSVEWINPDGTSGFAQIAGASIAGDTSRRPFRQPKKDFRLNFDSKYGVAGLDFDLFDASLPAGSFDELLLRNGGKRNWSYFDFDQRREADYINDEFARRAWLEMGNLGPRGTYVHLYLNGLYWGLYNVTEHVNAQFLSGYLNLPPESFELIYAGDDPQNLPAGTLSAVSAWNNIIGQLNVTGPVSDTLYSTVSNQVDVTSLADYLIHAHYIGKTDWPDEYWNAYRATTGDTRFKFVPLDNDSGLNGVTRNTTTVTDSVGPQDSPDSVFRRLLTNSQFQQVVADRFYKHVVSSDGALSATACSARYSDLAAIVDQAVIAESARWGDYMRDLYSITPPAGTNPAPKAKPAYLYSRDLPNAYTDDPTNPVPDNEQKSWVVVRDQKLSSYCPQRSTNLQTQYQTNSWYNPALQAPTASPAGGLVASGASVTLTNPNGAGAIHYTTDNSDPRPQNGGAPSAPSGTSVTINGNVTLKARVYNSVTGAWSPLLEKAFFIQQQFQNLVINEINYGPIAPAGEDASGYEFIELRNSGGAAINLEGVTFTGGVYFRFPAGASIPGNDYLVLAKDAAKFQARYGFAPDGVFTGTLLNTGETVELSNPVGTVIDTVSYTSAAPWPTGANAGGGSLSLKVPAPSDNSLPASWEASRINGGTPNAANDSNLGKTVPVLTITAPASIVYGTSLVGQLNATANVAGSFSFNPPLSTVLNAGADQPVQVIFTPSNTNTHAGVNQQVLIDVSPAPLTITAVNKVKKVGTPNPVLEASYSGFVNNDTAASLDVPPALSTTATDGSPVGTYPIVVTGAFDPNYTIIHVDGTLTVTDKEVPTINWATPAPIVYGTVLGPTQLNATATFNGGPVSGTFTYTLADGVTLASGKVPNAGPQQELLVTFTPTDSNTFVAQTASVRIDVTPAPLTIRADNKRKLVGTANPPLTATYQGLVNGDTAASLDAPAVLTTTAIDSSPVGLYAITVSGAADPNYAITFVNGVLTVATTLEEEPTTYTINLPLLAR